MLLFSPLKVLMQSSSLSFCFSLMSSMTMVSFESMLLKLLLSLTYVSDYSMGTVITLDSHGVIINDDEAL